MIEKILEKYKNERLLIISNNAMSTTRNNGKTILSYFDCLPKDVVHQLYFEQAAPTVDGYDYFRISDINVLKGIFSKKQRGSKITATNVQDVTDILTVSKTIVKKKNATTRLIRDLLWLGKWRSTQLIQWLDDICPTAIFFVGGDASFAYDICSFIKNRYDCKLTLYITDDYIMPRMSEGMITKLRRKHILKKMKATVALSDSFVTVSEPMRKAYREIFGKDSFVAVNMSESMRLEDVLPSEECFTLTYAGSLYYGRDAVLGKIAKAVESYNKAGQKPAKLFVFSNSVPNEKTREIFEIPYSCEYAGSLSRDELRVQLNKSDILVFVESFEKEQMEKTRFSLSTKVPEYLSVGHSIFAVGPKGIGSIDYLSDVAVCVDNDEDLFDQLKSILYDSTLRESLSKKARKKYLSFHDKYISQRRLLIYIFGR